MRLKVEPNGIELAARVKRGAEPRKGRHTRAEPSRERKRKGAVTPLTAGIARGELSDALPEGARGARTLPALSFHYTVVELRHVLNALSLAHQIRQLSPRVNLFFQATRRIVLVLLVAYIALLGLLYLAQGFLVYQARRGSEAVLLTHAAAERVEPWRDGKGSIIGWWRPNASARNRVVVFHGNAGYALHRTHFIEALHGLAGDLAWEARVFEYPGYGARPGTPSEKLLIAEAVAALTEMQAADPRPLFIFGESLGSGIASAVAAQLKEKIAGVALLVPYESLTHAAAFQYPFVPVKWLMRDRYDNVKALQNYKGRVAFILAEKDEIVTFAGGERLHSGYQGPKFLHVFPETGHNDVDYSPDAPWWRQVSEFLTAPAIATVGAGGQGSN